jgi:glycosyltransferase involved in cell wall biosynthesis
VTDAPTFSIVTPSYNRAWCIERAIGSVLRQSWADFELIVVDDASTDGTSEVVARALDPRVRLVRLDRNRGMYGAQVAGIEASRGSFIVLLDSDDELQPHALERFAANRRLFEPGVGVVMARFADSATGEPVDNEWVFEGRERLVYRELLCRPFMGDLLPCIRADVFQRVSWSRKSRNFTAVHWFRTLKAFDFAYLPEVLGVVHREGADRRTRSRAKDAARWVEGIEEFIGEFGDDLAALCPRRLGAFYRMLAIYQMAARRPADARRSLRRALRRNPRDWRAWIAWTTSWLPPAVSERVFLR